jgi:hypothetical protein
MRTPSIVICILWSVAALASSSVATADPATPVCQETACTTDAECGPGMRCQPDAVTQCVSVGGGPETCGPATLCEPIWNTTCTQDSDCGDGFACASAGETCECGDSTLDVPDSAVSTPCQVGSPTPPCDPEAPACPTLPPIQCSDSGTCLCWEDRQCQQKPTPACTTSSDCPSLFTCTSGACQPPCANLEVFGGSGGAAPPASTAPGGSTPSTPGEPSIASGQPAKVSAGCSVVPGAASGTASTSLLAFALALVARRRRRPAKTAA